MICNMPLGAPTATGRWSASCRTRCGRPGSSLPSRCWGWIDNRMFFGTDDGKVYEINPNYLNDDGKPINVDVQAAWSSYSTPGIEAVQDGPALHHHRWRAAALRRHARRLRHHAAGQPARRDRGQPGSEWDSPTGTPPAWAGRRRASSQLAGRRRHGRCRRAAPDRADHQLQLRVHRAGMSCTKQGVDPR